MSKNKLLFLGLLCISLVTYTGCSRMNLESHVIEENEKEGLSNEDTMSETALPEEDAVISEEKIILSEEDGQGDTALANMKEGKDELPVLQIEYSTDDTVQYAVIQSGDYEWTYEREDEPESVVACGAHPLEMRENLSKIPQVDKAEKIKFIFSKEPTSYTLYRYKTGTEEELDYDGEGVALSEIKDDAYNLTDESFGYVYCINAKFENGMVNYYFNLEI